MGRKGCLWYFFVNRREGIRWLDSLTTWWLNTVVCGDYNSLPFLLFRFRHNLMLHLPYWVSEVEAIYREAWEEFL